MSKAINDKITGTKALCVVFYSLAKASYSMPGKVFNRDRSLIYRWTREAGIHTPERDISEDIQEIESAEMRYFVKKEKKLWVIKAFDRGRRRTAGWTLGGCDTRTFKRLYDKVKHLKDAVYYTGDWTSFAKVLPAGRHVSARAGR